MCLYKTITVYIYNKQFLLCKQDIQEQENVFIKNLSLKPIMQYR